MAATALRPEERTGLILAAAAHAALVAFLVWRPIGEPVVLPPERMTVTISDEVGLTSTSPEPAAQAAPNVAPDLGEPAPAEPEPAPPKPIVKPAPAPPPPRPMAKPIPPRLTPRPAPRARPAPPRPAPPRAQPARPQPAARPAPARAQPAARPPRNVGASRIGDDFLKGSPAAQNPGASRNPPAATFGPSERASLQSAINRRLKPNWKAPSGVDVEKLDTTIVWELNRDGTLKGQPRFVSQVGKTPSNEAQAQRHIEQAIKAVIQSAPFDLPPQFYDRWKRLTWHFDRNLSQ